MESSNIEETPYFAYDSLELFCADIYSLSKTTKHSPESFLSLVDAALDSAFCLEQTKVVTERRRIPNVNNKTRSVKRGCGTICSSLMCSILVVSCLLVSPYFIFETTDEVKILISDFLCHQYQIFLPREYSYHLGVGLMNLSFEVVRTLRFIAVEYDVLPWLISSGFIKADGKSNIDECIVPNPFHNAELLQKPYEELCELCSSDLDVSYVSSDQKSPHTCNITAIKIGQICVLEGHGEQTNLWWLWYSVSKNVGAIRLQRYSFKSNVDFISSPKEFTRAEIIIHLLEDLPNDAHIEWTTEHYAVSRLIGHVFPRPHSISPGAQFYLQRALLIDGKNSKEFILQKKKYEYIIYFQGLGSRLIRLTPSISCEIQCSTHSVVMKENDILIYNAVTWDAYSLPSSDNTSFASWARLSLDDSPE